MLLWIPRRPQISVRLMNVDFASARQKRICEACSTAGDTYRPLLASFLFFSISIIMDFRTLVLYIELAGLSWLVKKKMLKLPSHARFARVRRESGEVVSCSRRISETAEIRRDRMLCHLPSSLSHLHSALPSVLCPLTPQLSSPAPSSSACHQTPRKRSAPTGQSQAFLQ